VTRFVTVGEGEMQDCKATKIVLCSPETLGRGDGKVVESVIFEKAAED